MPDNNDDYKSYDELVGKAGCRRNEADFILEYIPKGGTLLEIGTYHGFTIAYMALERPDVQFTSIDPFPSARVNKATDQYPIGNKKIWMQNHRKNNHLVVCDLEKYCEMFTAEALPKFDVVFVDGNHYYDYVLEDLKNSIRVVKPNGFIAVHDYGKISHADVKKAVDNFIGQTAWYIVGTSESVVVLERKSNE
jgi:predicted O-methyltransferase YrrM